MRKRIDKTFIELPIKIKKVTKETFEKVHECKSVRKNINERSEL